MRRKLGHLTIFILFLAILACGFVKVANEITPYVKEKSAVKVYYTSKPFDVTIDIGNYIIYIDDKFFSNLKNFIKEL